MKPDESNSQLPQESVANQDQNDSLPILTPSLIDDELIRARIRELRADTSPPLSRLHRILGHQLFAILFGFLLTALLGGAFTYLLNSRQKKFETQLAGEQRKTDQLRTDQQRESERIFQEQRRESDRLYQERQKEIDYIRGLQQKAQDRLDAKRQNELEYYRQLNIRERKREQDVSDETNKTRLQKIGEVWEKIDNADSEIDRLFERMDNNALKGQDSGEEPDKILKLVSDQQLIVEQKRFWLGQEIYERFMRYFTIQNNYVANRIVAPRGTDFTAARKAREQAKQDVLQIKGILMVDESAPSRQGTPKTP